MIFQKSSQWIVDYFANNCKNTLVIPFTSIINDIALVLVSIKSKSICGKLNIYCIVDKQYEELYLELFPDIKYEIFDNTGNNNLSFLYLRAHFIANDCSGIVLGSIDQTNKLLRKYDKLSEYTSDIFPLYGIKYSQLVKLVNNTYPNIKPKLEDDYETIEWCLDIDKKYGIITNDELPNKNNRWMYLMQNQKVMISKLHSIEKKTRHKIINKPCYE